VGRQIQLLERPHRGAARLLGDQRVLAGLLSCRVCQMPTVPAADPWSEPITAACIQRRLVARIAAELGLAPERIDADAPIAGLGLDSIALAQLLGDEEESLGRRVDPELLWQQPSIARLAEHLAASPCGPPAAEAPAERSAGPAAPRQLPEMAQLERRFAELAAAGIGNPFFHSFDGEAGATIATQGRRLLNFGSYNYLGLAGHPRVKEAATQAIERFGTSVSASRLTSGERGLHAELEDALAGFLGVPRALVFVGGHGTNVTVIGHLFGAPDLILYDALMHNSAVLGARLSGARCLPFLHNDLASLAQILSRQRSAYRQALILVEGVYSTDGDVPDLPALCSLKREHSAWLMVDDAHALGVLGERGRGLAEHWGVPPEQVDLHMGTLSKALASCGGYIGGSRGVIEYLRYTCPGFVFSAGITPPNAAAALGALQVLQEEPQRVGRLRGNAARLLARARARGLETGLSGGTGIVPVVVGNSLLAFRLSNRLFEQGLNVPPLVAPAVGADLARLRFFVCADHAPEQLDEAVELTAAALAELRPVASPALVG
jgi:8-amino-7-oxononanoate synthase